MLHACPKSTATLPTCYQLAHSLISSQDNGNRSDVQSAYVIHVTVHHHVCFALPAYHVSIVPFSSITFHALASMPSAPLPAPRGVLRNISNNCTYADVPSLPQKAVCLLQTAF
jgi:hypothetical protein